MGVVSEVTVQFTSEDDLQTRREEVLALLDVFKTYDEHTLHEELKEIDYLLGKGDQ